MTSSFDTGTYNNNTKSCSNAERGSSPTHSSLLIPSPVSSDVPANNILNKHNDYPAQHLCKGDTVYTMGENAKYVFYIEEGLIKQTIHLIIGHERIINIAGPGDYLGALGLQTHYPDEAEVISPTVNLRMINTRTMTDTVKQNVHLAAGNHMNHLRSTIEDHELPVSARLAKMFLRLGQRFGNITENERIHITLPLTHENFAAIVGAARETTSALLSEMRSAGVIKGTRGHYSFKYHELHDYALEIIHQNL